MWHRGAPNWNPVDLGVLDEALSTGGLRELPRAEMPAWASSSTHVTGAWLQLNGGEPLESTTALSTSVAQAEMLIEREHAEGARFRYDRFLFVKMADGRVFQGGPYKDVGFGHHHDERPAFLNELYSDSKD